jgi:hypothetical protein
VMSQHRRLVGPRRRLGFRVKARAECKKRDERSAKSKQQGRRREWAATGRRRWREAGSGRAGGEKRGGRGGWDKDTRKRQSGGGFFAKATTCGFLQNGCEIGISSSW